MTDNKISHQELQFTNKSGLSIYSQAWLPPSEPKANLFVVHGLGEHSGRYQHVAHYFVEKGLAVFALDHQGHGQSGGKRGHVNSFSDYIDDFEQFRQEMVKVSPNKPTILFGHSMGALVALLYLLDHQNVVSAAVISAPPLRVKMGPPAFIKDMVPSLAKVSPGFTMNSGLKPEWVSRDQTVVQAYKSDPLTHPQISLSLFSGMYNGGKYALENADKFTLPLFLLYGSEDKIVDGAAIQEFVDRVSSTNKKFIVFKNDFHEVHNEADQLDEFEMIWQWIKELLPINF